MSVLFVLKNRVDFMQLMVDAQNSENNKDDMSSTQGREIKQSS